MNRSAFRAAAPLAIVVALALPGCGPGDGASPGPSGGEDPDATVFLTQDTPPEAVMEALYVGKVNRDPQGCLRVESEGGAMVIWPYGFRLEARNGGRFVEDAKGRTVGAVGGDFRMGGGFVPARSYPFRSDADRTRAAACPSEYYWIVGDTG